MKQFSVYSLKPGGAVVSANEPENEWKEQKKKFHNHLARFFMKQPFCQRTIEELPWQLLMSGDIKTLVQVLTDPIMLEGFLDVSKKNPSNRHDLAFYWNFLNEEGVSVTTTYQQLLMKLGILEPIVYDKEEETDRDEVFSSLSREATPTIPVIITTPAPEREMSVIEEMNSVTEEPQGIEENKETVTKDDGIDTIFLTEAKHRQLDTSDSKNSSNYPAYATKLAWLIGQFLKDIGHSSATEDILISLNSKLQKNYPLSSDDLFLQARTQEMLGRFCQERGETQESEKWFVKSLRIVIEASDNEESDLDMDFLNLKGCLLSHLGYLRMKQGLYDSAEDLLKEGLEYVHDSGNLTAQADIQYNLGLLRTQQEDYILAESNLRQALLTREQWFGKAHPLVADTLFALAQLMGKKDNSKGYDKIRAESLYRKTVTIREACLGAKHLSVADTLLALGQLLMEEISFGAKTEAVGLLRRALDIKTTNLGGDHIDTVSVRNYLKSLEVKLKMGQYEFGPAKDTDVRTIDRPYSNMSWRDNDLKNLDRRSKLRTSSRAKSRGSSRPMSKDDRSQHTMSRMSNVSHYTASEKLMIETERPARLLNRESVERRLKFGKELVNGFHSASDNMKDTIVEIKENSDECERLSQSPEQMQENIIDSFGEDIAQSEGSPSHKRTQFLSENQESGPVKLFRRFGSAESSRSSKQNHRPPRESSAKSGSSYGTSYRTGSSLRSNASKKDLNPHAITLSNSTTVTSGPNCSLSSLLGTPKTPRDISRKIHHKSAWYHVPGRYQVSEDKLPPKRSQKTPEVKALVRRMDMNSPPRIHTPSYSTTPMKMKKHKHFSEPHVNNADNFGPTVKGLGPVLSEAHSSEFFYDEYENPGSTVQFRGAYIME